MTIITVAIVSGFIATGVLIVQLCLPTLLALILSACVGTRNNAVTWSVAARYIQSSYWPTLLRTDSVASSGVRKRVTVLTWLITLASFLIAIASIITPLGLYEAVVAVGISWEPFAYVRDPGPFGFATPDRSEFGFTRRCGNLFSKRCPGSMFPIIQTGNGSLTSIVVPWGYDGRIPRERYAYFASGLNQASDTIAGIWDIKWRSYGYKEDHSDIPMNNGSRYLVGIYKIFQPTALNEDATVVEGLVVDPSNAGIGFRNHSLPPNFVTNATWSEDLLFVTPETACVPLNLTLDLTIGNKTHASTPLSNLKITDRGGFVSIDKQFVPWVNGTQTQDELDLKFRAYMAGWLNNVALMWRYNITNQGDLNNDSFWFTGGWDYLNSEEGKTFIVNVDDSTPVFPNVFRSSPSFGDFLRMPTDDESLNTTISPNKDNGPFNISKTKFDLIPGYCQHFDPVNPGNVSTVAISCSMVYAPAIPEGSSPADERRPLTYDLGTRWTIPLYSCATALKASIKTVEFKLNGTSLLDLNVQAIKDKDFTHETDEPVWAVESTYMKLSDGVPLWGLVDLKAKKPANVTTVRREYLWLPGIIQPGLQGYIDVENMPSVDFPILTLSVLGRIGYTTTTLGDPLDFIGGSQPYDLADYSGRTNAAMFRKWQDLAVDADGVAEVINRVWTDIAVNAVVGTKGLMGRRSYADNDSDKLSLNPLTGPGTAKPITVFKRRIRYHWPFAIPAFIVLLAFLVTIALAITVCWTNRFGLGSIRQALHRTSMGRILGELLFAEVVSPSSSSSSPRLEQTSAWIRNVGLLEVDFSKGYPARGDEDEEEEKSQFKTSSSQRTGTPDELELPPQLELPQLGISHLDIISQLESSQLGPSQPLIETRQNNQNQ